MSNNNIYKEYLALAGFEGGEIDEMLPQWLEASQRLGLTDEDMAFAVNEWIPQHWDIRFKGVRKLIGGFTREAIEISKSVDYKKQGVKIVYGILPAMLTCYLAVKKAAGDKVFVSFPDIALVSFLNSFFHKVDPYLEAAERGGLTYGCRHCALNKTRIGAKMKNVIPSPDVIWVWGFNCDEGPKTDEYINCLMDQDWKYVISRIPHDTCFGEIDDEIVERVEYMAAQMKDGLNQVEQMTGIKVSDAHIREALKDTQRYIFKAGTLTSLVANADPLPLRGCHLTKFSQPMGFPFNSGLTYMEEALDIMIKEVRQEIKNGTGILPKGAPKVGCYFVPHAVPWIDRIFVENGVGLTFSLIMTPSKKQLSKSSYDDPFMAAAEQYLRWCIGQGLNAEAETMVEKVQANKPDAMLMGFFDFDRWLGAHQKICAKLIEERTGVSTFYMESDYWEDRDYSPEALRTRIESICQVVKLKKAMRGS